MRRARPANRPTATRSVDPAVRRLLAAIAAGVVLAAGWATPSHAADGTTSAVRIAYYGDSLAWEAEDHFVAAVSASGRAEVRTGTFGGTAICDYLDQMQRDAVEWRPDAVVVEFSGNALTPCMRDASGSDLDVGAYLRRYRLDAVEVVRTFAAVGARVYFAGSPISRHAERTGEWDSRRINDIYRSLKGARYIPAGAAVLRGGRYTDTLACLPFEPCTGAGSTNVVRAPDGNHFCPGGAEAQDGVTGECTVWASGAFRYGRAMPAPLVRDLGL